MLAVLDEGSTFGGGDDTVGGVDDLHFLAAAGDVAVSSVFHGDADGEFTFGSTFVHEAGAVEDGGSVDELGKTLVAEHLVHAVSLSISGAGLFGVGHHDFALIAAGQEVVPAFGHFGFGDEVGIDHEHHQMGVGSSPQAVFFHHTGGEDSGFGGLVGSKVGLGIVEDGNVTAPEHVAEGVGFFSGDTLHGFAGAHTHGGHGVTGLFLETLGDQVEQFRRIG